MISQPKTRLPLLLTSTLASTLVLTACTEQSKDNPDQIDMDDAIQGMAKAESVAIEAAGNF